MECKGPRVLPNLRPLQSNQETDTGALAYPPWRAGRTEIGDRGAHAALVDVRLLAVLRHVEAGGLVGGVSAERQHQANQP